MAGRKQSHKGLLIPLILLALGVVINACRDKTINRANQPIVKATSIAVTTTQAPATKATAKTAAKPTSRITQPPDTYIYRGPHREEYNAIAMYPMTELQSNTRAFRYTATADGCYIEFNGKLLLKRIQ